MALGLVFIGFTPIEQPRYVVAVVAEEAGYGAQTAAPIARAVLEALNGLPVGPVSAVAPAIAAGNAVVAVPSEVHPLAVTDFYQVLETSDVPAGVVNILTGRKDELLKVLAELDRLFNELEDYRQYRAGMLNRLVTNLGGGRPPPRGRWSGFDHVSLPGSPLPGIVKKRHRRSPVPAR
mgnify:CR=1 FL=1